ncbi:hypothetical protein CRUP_016643, partial [Coryphaenoides rupestris]
MYCAYPVPGTPSNPMMYCYNMKPVYGQCPDNEDINQNPTSHLSNKSAGNVFASTFFEATSNSADIWNTANGLNQQGYEAGGPRGGLASLHHAEHGNYNNHHLIYSPDHSSSSFPSSASTPARSPSPPPLPASTEPS